MARLVWDSLNYRIGVDRGVYYKKNAPGEVWNGLIAVNKEISESEERSVIVDGVKVNQRRSQGAFAGSIQAVTYPDSLTNDVFGISLQQSFDLSYRTLTPSHHQIHLVYNVLLSPSQYAHQQGDVEAFNWGFTTVPVPVPDAKPSAHLIIESSIAYSWTVAALEDVLYGTEMTDPTMPTPAEVWDIFEENSILRIIDNGDGSWTAIGPDSVVQLLDATTFQIDWPSAVYIDTDRYTVSSL